ncbi:MAG: hypothetical protein H7222_06795 [Methylotenera sp.]|nr:hypothetical protein [Oligoflexia bacterium]
MSHFHIRGVLFLLALALGSASANASVWSDPRFQSLTVIHSHTGCSGIAFWISKKALPDSELTWAKKVIDFAFGGPDDFELKDGMGIDFGEKSETPLSVESMKVLMKNAAFRTWAGSRVTAGLEELIPLRTRVESETEKKRFKDSQTVQTFGRDPLILAYVAKQKAVLKALREKIKLMEQNIGDDCD